MDEFGDILKNVFIFIFSIFFGWEYSIVFEGFKLSLVVELGDSSTIVIDLLLEY